MNGYLEVRCTRVSPATIRTRGWRGLDVVSNRCDFLPPRPAVGVDEAQKLCLKYLKVWRPCPPLGHAVLPSRSALSDIGLIVDLCEKTLLNWSSFCQKSTLFGQKGPTSLFLICQLQHNANN